MAAKHAPPILSTQESGLEFEMETFLRFVEILVAIEAIAVGLAFVSGMIVAPILVLAHRALWWKKRFKWVAVCAVTSWMGFWFFLRDQRESGASISASSAMTHPFH